MWSLRRKRAWVAILMCGAGTAFAVLPRGCLDYTIVTAVQSFNFCSVVNCNGGTYFTFCPPGGGGLLADCPSTTTTQTTTGTTTGTTGTTGP